MRCSACATVLIAGADACPNCGAPLDLASAETITAAAAASNGSALGRVLAVTAFQPGDIVAQRYRIVALVGRGGMGEVYRADDLRLRQPVALKFLPPRLRHDAEAGERMLQEIRLARRISHPNVCRVYDLGESEGRQFLSMEFVDGEDLASLLRRIGRLPHEKGIEIAHQLCAALSAAHAQGVLHRDLKPANVMLDGEGRLRLTDFGVAAVARHYYARSELAGTLAYMAPEQLRGQPASVQTDLYALGLVLHELFTGRREGSGAAAIDPLVNRALQWCLQEDPALRPRSAAEMGSILPGGDQLARIVASGETPSPELVAAAGTSEVTRLAVAWSCMAIVLAGLAFTGWAADDIMLFRKVPLNKPPAALEERVDQILSRLGRNAPIRHANGWSVDDAQLRYAAEHDSSRERWNRLATGRPGVIKFWSRRTPTEFVSPGYGVTGIDSPPLRPNEIRMSLDSHGSLVEFTYVLPPVVTNDTANMTTRWRTLFEEAGLDAVRFTRVNTKWVPPVAFDDLVAWAGPEGAPEDQHIQVVGATYRNSVSYFALLGPWTLPNSVSNRLEPVKRFRLQYEYMLLSIFTAIAIILARRNWRAGRVDTRGAATVASFVALLHSIGWVVRADHAPDFEREWRLFSDGAGLALFRAATIFVFYIALEPAVRRRWPYALVSWSRLVAGRLRDPLVGRDILIGMTAGAIVMALFVVNLALPGWLGWPSHRPWTDNIASVTDWRRAMEIVSFSMSEAILIAFLGVLFLLLIRAVVPHKLISSALFIALGIIAFLYRGEYVGLELLFAVGQALTGTVVLLRYGVLALIVTTFCRNAVQSLPLALDVSAWYSSQIAMSLGILISIAAYGLYASTGGQLLPRRVLEE